VLIAKATIEVAGELRADEYLLELAEQSGTRHDDEPVIDEGPDYDAR
jgi:hypothetical protein